MPAFAGMTNKSELPDDAGAKGSIVTESVIS